MENENSKKKTTAPDTSVGADDGQPLHNSTENSISAFEEEINGDFQNSTESLDEIYRTELIGKDVYVKPGKYYERLVNLDEEILPD